MTELAGLGVDGEVGITDEVLRSMAVAGTPAGCAQSITDLAAASLVAGSRDHRGNVERFAEEVLPLLSRSTSRAGR